MPVINKKKQLLFEPLFKKFITASKSGRRLQANGKRISAGSIDNYEYALKLIQKYCIVKELSLRLRPVRYLNKRELQAEKKYWKKFYLSFTDYLYKDCGHFDNYVGQTLKVIRTVFNYLNKELLLGVGDFHKLFFVRKEEVPVLTLLPEELNHLIYSSSLEEGMSRKLKEAKNVFVFGCTVALRFSDLMTLNKSNLRKVNDIWYLVVRSKKTSTDTQIRLPDYAISILQSFKLKGNRLLPKYFLSTLFTKNPFYS